MPEQFIFEISLLKGRTEVARSSQATYLIVYSILAEGTSISDSAEMYILKGTLVFVSSRSSCSKSAILSVFQSSSYQYSLSFGLTKHLSYSCMSNQFINNTSQNLDTQIMARQNTMHFSRWLPIQQCNQYYYYLNNQLTKIMPAYNIIYNYFAKSTANTTMDIIKLQEHLKNKKKQLKTQWILSIILTLDKQQSSISITQKGIIIELLARICLQEYEMFAKILAEFSYSLQSGKQATSRIKTTQRKSRNRNSTTNKKIKQQNPQNVRIALDLNQLLEKQLSTPHNTQSNHDKQSNLRRQIEIQAIEKLQITAPNIQDFLTPLKQTIPQDEQNRNFDQIRVIIDVGNYKKQRTRTKNKQATIKTRKKGQITQLLQQQINSDISLNLVSQLSIRKQIENILQVTKKKKANEKQRYFDHQIFVQLGEQFDFTQKQNIRNFSKESFQKLTKNKKLLQNQSQHSFHSPFLQIDLNQQNRSQIYIERKIQQELDDLQAFLTKQNRITFQQLSNKNKLNLLERSALFYDLLSNPDRFVLTQREPQKFGDIIISNYIID